MLSIDAILAVLLVVPTLYLGLVSAYLLLLTFGAYFYRKPRHPAPPITRFALIIPAHDEEENIETALATAAGMEYPTEAYTVVVVADNCTDETAAVARAAGALVFERHDPVLRGKGPALDWCLRSQRVTLEHYAGIAVVDADMRIDPRFLAEMNATLCVEGVSAVQALNTVARPEAHWRSALGYAGFSVINHIRPAGRCWLGGTSELKGSGMAFRTPLLMKYGWPAHSLAEDAEFAKLLFLEGVLVAYNPDAKVTSEIPRLRAQASVQQRRWEGGRWHLFRKYSAVFLRGALRRPCLRNADALLDIITPPLSLLVLGLVLFGALGWIVHPVVGLVYLAELGAVAFCVLSALYLTRAPVKVWLYMAAAPVFVAWKLMVFGSLLLRRQVQWQRTPRDLEVKQRERSRQNVE